MPNGYVHNTAGGFCGVFTYLMIQNNLQQREKVGPGELILSAGIGISTREFLIFLNHPFIQIIETSFIVLFLEE